MCLFSVGWMGTQIEICRPKLFFAPVHRSDFIFVWILICVNFSLSIKWISCLWVITFRIHQNFPARLNLMCHVIKLAPAKIEEYLYIFYTCQLFLRYRHEIFILGVLGFWRRHDHLPKNPEEVWSLLKMFEVCWRRIYRENAYPQGPTLVDNISAIVLKSESFGLTWSIFFKVVVMLVFPGKAIKLYSCCSRNIFFVM